MKKILNKWFDIKNINIEKVIYKWFEMKLKTYDRLEHDGSIYLYDEGEEYAEIRIDKKNREIIYKWSHYKEFSDIISLENLEFEKFMVKWVGDTFGLMGFTPKLYHFLPSVKLEIPKIDN